MRTALFSDIHTNLPAFEEALKSIDAQKPDTIYCLCNLVGYHLSPNEVINEIRRRGIATIAGNHDAKASKLTVSQLSEPGKNYPYTIMGEEEKNYLTTNE